MNINEWCRAVSLIAKDVNRNGSEPFQQRKLIFGLWSAFRRAPHEIHTLFDAISDDNLRENGANYAHDIGKGTPLIIPDVKRRPEFVQFAASVLRGLEQSLIGSGDRKLWPRTREQLEVSYRDERGFLIPVRPRFKSGKEGQAYFSKRGLVATRCIPEKLIDDKIIDVRYADRGPKSEELTCVGQLFEECIPLNALGSPVDFSVGGEFIFHELADLPANELHDRLREAWQSHPHIIVFPELTMCQKRRRKL